MSNGFFKIVPRLRAMKVKKVVVLVLAGATLTWNIASGLAADASHTQTSFDASLDVVKGKWVRPDGGYVITIKDVEASGQLDAAYANPRPLPFAKARVSLDGETIRLFFELRAGGYNGSTYTLVYDPVHDVLKGVYFQAVAQQKYDIYFTRATP